ncbi:MAG: glycerol-3-phosphate dehydrogenase subunit GlpB, partial [Propionibacteriaceae bacterium]|nr:glycerol-3-phosphate dehydrogenase subunit GlpB [Propionibacteriaceae bacterium]
GRVQSVTLATTGRDRTLTASAFVYAPGGIESGALHLDSYGRLTERVFDLPLRAASELVTADDPTRQELFRAGVATDDRMRPVDADGEVVYANLHVAGGLLAGALRWNEKSGEGIALGSALRAADSIGEDLA